MWKEIINWIRGADSQTLLLKKQSKQLRKLADEIDKAVEIDEMKSKIQKRILEPLKPQPIGALINLAKKEVGGRLTSHETNLIIDSISPNQGLGWWPDGESKDPLPVNKMFQPITLPYDCIPCNIDYTIGIQIYNPQRNSTYIL